MAENGVWRLALPLAIAQALFFAAPLLLLAATSFATDENLRAWSLRAWRDVLGDGFHIDSVPQHAAPGRTHGRGDRATRRAARPACTWRLGRRCAASS